MKRLVAHRCTGRTKSCLHKKDPKTGKFPIVADVYKVGHCVRCQFNVFGSTNEAHATDPERKKFLSECFAKAIDKKLGHIMDNFRCTGFDEVAAGAAVAGF